MLYKMYYPIHRLNITRLSKQLNYLVLIFTVFGLLTMNSICQADDAALLSENVAQEKSYFEDDTNNKSLDSSGLDNAKNKSPLAGLYKNRPAENGISSSSYIEMLVALVLIVMLIGGLAWGLRRLNLPVMAGTSKMKLESTLSLGHKEKLIIVNVENQRLLLATTGAQITLIDRLAASTEIKEERVFSGKLKTIMSRGQK